MPKHQLRGLSAGLAAASIWGGMYVVSKVVLEVIPPFALLTTRLVLGIAALGVVIAARPKAQMTRRQFWQMFLVGFVGYGVSLAFQFVGTKLSTASNGSLVTSATPAFVLLFAPFLLGEKITSRRLIALVISTLGVAAVIDPRTAELSPALFWGNLSLLAAALTWALYSVLVRKVSQTGDLLTASAIMLAGGIPSSLLFGAWEIQSQGMGEITLGVISGILFLGIILPRHHLHRHRHVPVELRVRGTARGGRLTDVLRATGGWDNARRIFSRRKNHTTFSVRGIANWNWVGDCQHRKIAFRLFWKI